MFRRAPAFTGAFVLVMALGVGATTAVFALVDGLVLRDLPVSRPDRPGNVGSVWITPFAASFTDFRTTFLMFGIVQLSY